MVVVVVIVDVVVVGAIVVVQIVVIKLVLTKVTLVVVVLVAVVVVGVVVVGVVVVTCYYFSYPALVTWPRERLDKSARAFVGRTWRWRTEGTIRLLWRGAQLAQVVLHLFGALVPLQTCGGRRQPGLAESAVCVVPVDLICYTVVEARRALIGGEPLL